MELSLSNDGGIHKKIIREGEGCKPVKGMTVVINYTGFLNNGKEFDSSFKYNFPFVFKIGIGQVIPVWDIGILTMKKGEKSLLICSSKYAYGEYGLPTFIPSRSSLTFEIELLNFY